MLEGIKQELLAADLGQGVSDESGSQSVSGIDATRMEDTDKDASTRTDRHASSGPATEEEVRYSRRMSGTSGNIPLGRGNIDEIQRKKCESKHGKLSNMLL